MECELIIRGDFSEIQQALRALHGGDEALSIYDRQRMHEDFRRPSNSPAGPEPKPDEKHSSAPVAAVAKAGKQMDKGNVKAKIPAKSCNKCGTSFTPRYETSLYCSKKCYMAEYVKDHKPKASPPPEITVYDRGYVTRRPPNPDALNEKLKKIKETCPKPVPRPELSRDLC